MDHGATRYGYFHFYKNIIDEKPINIFNYGKMKRDFTYVDDIVSGIYGSIKLKMKKHHKVYNLGNNRSESLLEFIKIIEKNLNKKAKKNFFLFNLVMYQQHLLIYLKVLKI